MQQRGRGLRGWTAMVLFLALIAGCGKASAPAPSQPGQPGPAAATPTPAPTGPKRVLNVLCWEGYADPAFVQDFEKANNVEVRRTYIGSNDEIFGKLAAGGTAYDLISPSSDTTMKLIDAGLVQPLNLNNIPNYKDLYDVFQKPKWLVKDGKVYGVSYGWGPVFVTVNADKIPNPEQSLKLLWDKQYSGKISLWDDISSIYTGAQYLGIADPYHMTDEQLAKVKEALLQQKPLVRKYWSTSGELEQMFQSGEVWAATAWALTGQTLRGEGMHIIEYLPKEGAQGWTDSWMIPKDSKNKDLAEAFINHLISGKATAEASKITNYSYPNNKILDFLTPERARELHQDDPQWLFHLNWWQPVPNRDKYNEVWNQVKS